MSDQQPYSKVTIIVEEGDITTTIRVPVAQDVSWAYNSVLADPVVGRRDAVAGLIDLKLELRSIFDNEKNYHYTIQRVDKEGKPVEF